MASAINIVFNEPGALYFPGQVISGKVIVSLINPQNCNGVKMIFRGFSKVHWEEEKKKDNMDVTHHFESKEEYYHMKFYVWGNGSPGSIPAGHHNFDFKFVLPHHIPSSFQSKIGYIRHTCTAKLERPFNNDLECSVPYSVNVISDLNLIPEAQNPVHVTKTKNLCCLCCKSGPVSFVMNIKKSGYVCGEQIAINAECTNMTDRVMKKSKAELVQVITYYAENSRKEEKRVVAEVEHPEIPPGESDIWSNVLLKVPALPPSNLQGCSNIEITYNLVFRVNTGFGAVDLQEAAPVIIGSIPLWRDHSHIIAPSYTETLPGNPSAPQLPPQAAGMVFPGSQLYPEMPPPAYEKCFFGPEQYNESGNNMGPNFAPSYVSYGFSPNY